MTTPTHSHKQWTDEGGHVTPGRLVPGSEQVKWHLASKLILETERFPASDFSNMPGLTWERFRIRKQNHAN
jgi:hypothetical protein